LESKVELKLTLSIDETNAIMQVLGQLPTQSGAYPLLMKIKAQAESQLPEDVEPVETPSAA
jgi:hypothetical protein